MALLDLLATLQVPTTFFCIGERVKAHPGMAARAAAQGHELGNHLWRDRWSLLLGEAAFCQQLEQTAEAIQLDLARAGLPERPLRWFRPAGGWSRPTTRQWAERGGYKTVLGTIWPLDGIRLPLLSDGRRLELQQRWLRRFAHPGGILVLHDSPAANPLTRATLASAVPELQRDGYTFATLAELLESA